VPGLGDVVTGAISLFIVHHAWAAGASKLTLARKLASVVLRLWKNGELWDPTKLTMQAT